MNLSLTSSLISLGREVFDQIIASSEAQTDTYLQPSSKSFVTEMKEAQELTTGPNLAQLSESYLRDHLLNDPTVASFVENNPNCQIFLQKRADGTMQLGSSSGQTIVLEQNSQVNLACLAYFEKSMLNGTSQSPLRPEAIILKF